LTLPSYFSSLFSHSHAPTRHLHSFPTRRSSDLYEQLFHIFFLQILLRDHLIEHREKRIEVISRINKAKRLFMKTDLPPCIHFKEDRKSTRLNSSHVSISYAVFCLKKKKKESRKK